MFWPVVILTYFVCFTVNRKLFKHIFDIVMLTEINRRWHLYYVISWKESDGQCVCVWGLTWDKGTENLIYKDTEKGTLKVDQNLKK